MAYTAQQKLAIVNYIDQSSKHNRGLACREKDISISTYRHWKCEIQEQMIQELNLKIDSLETKIDNLMRQLIVAKTRQPREIQDELIVKGILADKTYSEIAKEVELSISGVKKRLVRIYREHQVKNRQQLAVQKAREGIAGATSFITERA